MKYSKLFGKSRHNIACDNDSVNAKFLTQGGFVEKLSAGIYNYLPLGYRVLTKICQIVREEMNAVDSQEVFMPILHPVEIWEQTGRNRTMTDILFRTKGHGEKDFILGPSHEEIITPLVVSWIQSYKELPLSLYQIQAKFRNEPRAKSGILRGREFGMKDMYSFHMDEKDLDLYYEKVKQAYFNVFGRCGLKSYIVEASGGVFSDKISHEYQVETPAGEDTILICEKCGLAQNLEIARGKFDDFTEDEQELDLETVDIERGFSVTDNAKAHNVPEHKILKTVVFDVEDSGLIGVVIRGDLSINEHKLEKYLRKRFRPASAETLEAAGLVQGYISPVNMSSKVALPFIADLSIKSVKNFVTGANEFGKDYRNVNIGRDFTVKDFADFVEVKSGFKCPECDSSLRETKAIEAGNIFKLGTKYSEAFNLKVTDSNGDQRTVIMGCYGIGTTRLMGTIVEACHDEKGIIWPKTVTPYQVHLVNLGNDEEVIKTAEKVYEDFKENGIDVLFDDRNENAGVKLKDCDLIGIPLRLIVSKKTLEKQSLEWKNRDSDEVSMVKLSTVVNKVKKFYE